MRRSTGPMTGLRKTRSLRNTRGHVGAERPRQGDDDRDEDGELEPALRHLQLLAAEQRVDEVDADERRDDQPEEIRAAHHPVDQVDCPRSEAANATVGVSDRDPRSATTSASGVAAAAAGKLARHRASPDRRAARPTREAPDVRGSARGGGAPGAAGAGGRQRIRPIGAWRAQHPIARLGATAMSRALGPDQGFRLSHEDPVKLTR